MACTQIFSNASISAQAAKLALDGDHSRLRAWLWWVVPIVVASLLYFMRLLSGGDEAVASSYKTTLKLVMVPSIVVQVGVGWCV